APRVIARTSRRVGITFALVTQGSPEQSHGRPCCAGFSGRAGLFASGMRRRHGRAWPGHPRLHLPHNKTWMSAPSTGMTINLNGMHFTTAMLTYEPVRPRSFLRSPKRRRRRIEPAAAHGGGEADQARPAHLVALLDGDRVLPVGELRCDEPGEGGSGRS